MHIDTLGIFSGAFNDNDTKFNEVTLKKHISREIKYLSYSIDVDKKKLFKFGKLLNYTIFKAVVYIPDTLVNW